MVEAVRWFNRRAAQADAAACATAPSSPRPPRILVFNCGSDKDVLQLLLPLSTTPFDHVYLTSIPWLLTAKRKRITADEALAGFLARRELMNDHETVAEVRQGLAARDVAATASGSGSGSDGAAVESSSPGAMRVEGADAASQPWQHALASIYAAVHERPEFTLTRTRLMRECSAPAPSSSSSHGCSESVVLPPAAPVCTILPSIADVLADITRARAHSSEDASATSVGGGTGSSGGSSDFAVASAPAPAAHVLVTGSLYLVGAAIEQLQAHGMDG